MSLFSWLSNTLFRNISVNILYYINQNIFLYILNLKDSLKVKGFFDGISLENIVVNCPLIEKKLQFSDVPFIFKKIYLKSCLIQFFFFKRTVEISVDEVTVLIEPNDNEKVKSSSPFFGEEEIFWFYRKVVKVKNGITTFLHWKSEKRNEIHRFDTVAWIMKRLDPFKKFRSCIYEKWKNKWKIDNSNNKNQNVWFSRIFNCKQKTSFVRFYKKGDKSCDLSNILWHKSSSFSRFLLNYVLRYIPNVNIKCYNIRITFSKFLKYKNEFLLYIEKVTLFYENNRLFLMWPLKNQKCPSFSVIRSKKFKKKNSSEGENLSKTANNYSSLNLQSNSEKSLNYQGIFKNVTFQFKSTTSKRKHNEKKLPKKRANSGEKQNESNLKWIHQKKKTLEKQKKRKKKKGQHYTFLKGSFDFEINAGNEENSSLNLLLCFSNFLYIDLNAELLLMIDELLNSANEEQMSWILNYYKPKRSINDFVKKTDEKVSILKKKNQKFEEKQKEFAAKNDRWIIQELENIENANRREMSKRICNSINRDVYTEKGLFHYKKEKWKTYFLNYSKKRNEWKDEIRKEENIIPSNVPFFDIQEKYIGIKKKKCISQLHNSRKQYFSDTDMKFFVVKKKKSKIKSPKNASKTCLTVSKGSKDINRKCDVVICGPTIKEKYTNMDKKVDKHPFLRNEQLVSWGSYEYEDDNNVRFLKKKVIRQWWFHLYKCVLFKVLKKKKKLNEVITERINTRSKYIAIIKTFLKSENEKLANYFQKNINELNSLCRTDENINFIFHLYKYSSATDIIHWHLLALQDFHTEEEVKKKEKRKGVHVSFWGNKNVKKAESDTNKNYSYRKEFHLHRMKHINRFFFYQKYMQCFPCIQKFNDHITFVEYMFINYKNLGMTEKKNMIRSNRKESGYNYINCNNSSVISSRLSLMYDPLFFFKLKHIHIQLFFPEFKIRLRNGSSQIHEKGKNVIQVVIYQLGNEFFLSRECSFSLCFHSLYVTVLKKFFLKIENKETPTSYKLIHMDVQNMSDVFFKKNAVTSTSHEKKDSLVSPVASFSPNKKKSSEDISSTYVDALNIKRLFECPLRNDKVNLYKGIAYLIRKKIEMNEIHNVYVGKRKSEGIQSKMFQHYFHQRSFTEKVQMKCSSTFQKLTKRLSVRNLINLTNILSLLHFFKITNSINFWIKHLEIEEKQKQKHKQKQKQKKKINIKENMLNESIKTLEKRKNLKQYLLRVKNKVLPISNQYNYFQIILSPCSYLFLSDDDIHTTYGTYKTRPHFLYIHFYITQFQIHLSRQLFDNLKKEFQAWKQEMGQHGLKKHFLNRSLFFGIYEMNIFFLNNNLNRYLQCQPKNNTLIYFMIKRIQRILSFLEKQKNNSNIFFLLNTMRNKKNRKQAMMALLEKVESTFFIIKIKMPNIHIYMEKQKRIFRSEKVIMLIFPVDLFESKRLVQNIRHYMKSSTLKEKKKSNENNSSFKYLSHTLAYFDRGNKIWLRFFFYFSGFGLLYKSNDTNNPFHKNDFFFLKLYETCIEHISNFLLIHKEYFMDTYLFFLIFYFPHLKKNLQILKQSVSTHISIKE